MKCIRRDSRGLTGREPRRAGCHWGYWKAGQVVVEVMLILPVFLLMIFSIMEIGYIAFQTIVTQHAAYECARIGSMMAGSMDPNASPDFKQGLARGRAAEQLSRMIRGAQLSGFQKITTLTDPQTGFPNYDLLVEVSNPVTLIFPGSSYLLATPKGSGRRLIKATARMPVENPAKWTLR